MSNLKPLNVDLRFGSSDISCHLSKTLRVLTSFLALSLVVSVFGNGTTNWSRDVTDGGSLRNYPGITFSVLSTSSIDDHLSAICTYQYISDEGLTILRGTRDASGEFVPFVSYQVAEEGRTKWRTIGTSPQASQSTELEVGPANLRALLDVDMEVYRSSIGKFRWGRIVLENGDAAPFALDDLLPTADNPGRDGSFSQSIAELSAKRFGSSFSLVKVTSFSKRVIGDFIFAGGGDESCADLKGIRDRNEDFWPSVTLQVANSNDKWKTVGKSGEDGTQILSKVCHQSPLETLRISLDAFKSTAEKFTYGKVVFSNGDFAVFEIRNLRPHAHGGN
jgi:hypothetical protein